MPPGPFKGGLDSILSVPPVSADQDGDPQQAVVLLLHELFESHDARRAAWPKPGSLHPHTLLTHLLADFGSRPSPPGSRSEQGGG